MTHGISRRGFLAAASAVVARPAAAQPLRTAQLSVYFVGLAFFERQRASLNVGLVKGLGEMHQHMTLVVIPKTSVNGTPGGAQTPTQADLDQWNLPERTHAAGDLWYWVAKQNLNFSFSSSAQLSHSGIRNLFPLTSYGDGRLDKNWSSKCVAYFEFPNGRFQDRYRRSSCGHTDASWDAIDESGNAHVEGWTLRDYVRGSAEVSAIDLEIDGKPVEFKLGGPVPITIARLLTSKAGHRENQAAHCRAYFALLESDVHPVWPYRQGDIVCSRDTDPVFCPPGM